MRKIFLSLFFFCLSCSLQGDHLDPSDGIVQETLYCRGIILLGPDKPLYSEEALENWSDTQYIYLDDLQFNGDQGQLIRYLQCQFINQPLDENSLNNLQQAICSFYERHYHPLVRVIIPPQNISSAILQVRVVESRLAQVEVQGGKYTSPQVLKNYLGIHPDETIDIQKLKKNLTFMNRNPYRRVDAIYSAGEFENTTDITLLVEDRRPVTFFFGSDNTGIETTERTRLYTGIHLSELFGLDNFFAYQYTAAPDINRFQAHTAQFAFFLPFQKVLNFYGGYSEADADLPPPSKKTKGHSMQACTRYTIPLDPATRLNHEFTCGFDYKNTNNTIEFAELNPTVGDTVNLSQFMVGYGGNFVNRSPDLRLDFDAQLYFSPGALLPNESNAAYQTLRPSAKNHWIYAKAMVKYLQKFPYLSLFCWLRGQLSSQNLLPSEQVGIGGFDTVRGYDQNQLTTDYGFIGNFELHSPSVSLLRKRRKDALLFLAFVDYGYGRNHTPLPGEPTANHLLGVGPGVRYTLNPWLTARLDLGFKLETEPSFTAGDAVWHFGFHASI